MLVTFPYRPLIWKSWNFSPCVLSLSQRGISLITDSVWNVKSFLMQPPLIALIGIWKSPALRSDIVSLRCKSSRLHSLTLFSISYYSNCRPHQWSLASLQRGLEAPRVWKTCHLHTKAAIPSGNRWHLIWEMVYALFGGGVGGGESPKHKPLKSVWAF